ncbi:MAG: hypothetical protein IKD85_01465 [Firmicutes bacterium]|nr:hypothetical protein [Bacillota bacterium]
MLKKKYTMIILILLLVLVLFGLLMTQLLAGNYAVMGRKLSSWNGEYTIGVPRNWDSCDAPNSTTLISAKTSRDDMYLLVSLDSYDYGPDMTLDSYISNYLVYVAGNSDQADETKLITLPEVISVDGISGYYYEYTAISDGIPLHMFCYAAQTDAGYLSVQVASNEAEAEENRNIAENIIASLRVHRENVQPQAAADAGGDAGEPAEADSEAAEAADAAAEEAAAEEAPAEG